MATKAKVLNLLKKQGAEWEEGHDSEGDYFFEAWLPEGLYWDSGYGCGIVTQTREAKESAAQFWDGILAVADAEVISTPYRI
jgi:hypothetical protein